MTEREKAIAMILELSGGKGFNWEANLGVVEQGELAKQVWHNEIFTYGMEYGAMIALSYIFGLTEDDFK